MRFRIGSVIGLLALAALACGLSDVGLEPTALPTRAGESAAEPTGVPTEDLGPDSIDLSDSGLFTPPASVVSSYRTTLNYRIEGVDEEGEFVQGAVVGEGVVLNQAGVSSLELMAESTDLLSEVLPVKAVKVGRLTTLYEPSRGCRTFAPGGSTVPLAGLTDLQLLLVGQAPRIQPDENVSGLDAYVYELALENINTAAVNLQELKEGRLYVAKREGFVVKLSLEGTGSSELLSGDPEFVGQLRYEFGLHEFGQEMEISPPVECVQVDSIQEGLQLPRLFDAFGEVTYPGITTYLTEFAYQESVLFYRGEMINAGWNLLDIEDDGRFALMTFSNDLFAVQIAVQQDPITSQVVITEIQIEN